MYLYSVDVFGLEQEIYRFPFALVNANMFFLPNKNTGIVIDPNENEELLSIFKQCGTESVTIVLTHEHYDHTIGVEWLKGKIEARLFCHRACAERIATVEGNNPKTLGYLLTIRDVADGGHRRDDFMATAKSYVLHADETFEGESCLDVGGISLNCYSTPGHSQGSAVYILGGKYVFTGDSLIQGIPTILKLPGSDRSKFKEITKPFLRSLSKDVTVFPGHGDPFNIREAKFL